jgi:putative toxin-antitoxin system antitoxin component (TIGR02293 family)
MILWSIKKMVLVTPEKIASVMALMPVPHSFAELDDLVSKGLPKGALKASIKHICKSSEDQRHLLYRIIPEATYKRRRDNLSAEESGRAERLARIFATAHYVWDSEDNARVFLITPHSMLQERTPLDVSMTELGARRVEELLWKLYYGIAA